MLFFNPQTDIDEIKAIYSDKQFSGDCARISALDGDSEIGSCFVAVNGYKCCLSDICVNEPDDLLVEGLIRSALNFAANRGAYIAECSDFNYLNVLKTLGFEKSDSGYSGEIPELLKGSCCK